MESFQKDLKRLEAADTQVLGVSVDSPFANKAFAEQIGVTFPLLSDWGGEISKQLGLFNEQYKAARRVTFLVNKEGKITYMQMDREAIDPTAVVEACERQKLKD